MLRRPHGQVLVPCFLFGAVGLIVALVFKLLGWLDSVKHWLLESMQSLWIAENKLSQMDSLWVYVLAALFCFGVAYAVLDSRGLHKRVMLCVSAILLTLGLVPSFLVWGIAFLPFFQIIALTWTSICVLVYSAQHIMPCDKEESLSNTAVKPTDPLVEEIQPTAPIEKVHDIEVPDPDAAYKPRP